MIAAYDDMIRAATEYYLPEGYDYRMLKAQYWQESRLQKDAVSPAGASGIAQFMPKTWREWAPEHSDIFDPEASIDTGAEYMAWLIGQWSWPRPEIDRICLALASYNAGIGHILDAQELSGGQSLYGQIIGHLHDVTGDTHSAETRGYVLHILQFYAMEVTRHD